MQHGHQSNTSANTGGIFSGPVRFRRSLLAVGLSLALSGIPLVVSQPATAAVDPASASTVPARVGFADVIERVEPAVVSVSVTGKAISRPDVEFFSFNGQGPFGDLFRRFFEEHEGLPEGAHGLPERVRGMGSGFVIDPSGYIVTNDHVVDGADAVTVTLSDGVKRTAKVVGHDEKTDLALLKVQSDEPPPYVEFGDSDRTRVGDWVLAVGNPFGLGGSVTAGIVSARGRDIHTGPFDDYLQVDAPINRGNSGGPLFDSQGEVIGVNTAIFSPSGGSVGIGFAIPAKLAKSVVEELKSEGHVARGWLGVAIQPVTAEVAEGLGIGTDGGALVASVVEGSPADRAGIQTGDVIREVNGEAIKDFKDLPRVIAGTKSGTQVSIDVLRQGHGRALQVVIGTTPEQPRDAWARSDAAGNGESRLGLRLGPLTPNARRQLGLASDAKGVLVEEVQPGSPADQAGIHPGNVISMIGQEPIADPGELADKVQAAAKQKRSSVVLLVESEGEQHFVAVPLSA